MESPSWKDKDYIGTADIMKIFSVSRPTAITVMRKMPYIKIGKALRVSRPAFEKYLKDNERACRRGV
jgi:hypothetical protein